MTAYSHNANSLMPLMTANNAPSPVIVSDSTASATAYLACNTDASDTGWFAAGASGWWKAYSGVPWVVDSYTIAHNYQYGTYPSAWTFLGSNDDVNWDTLDTRSAQVFDNLEMKTFSFSNVQPYVYYKINVTGNNGGSWVGFSEIELIGTIYTGITWERLAYLASVITDGDTAHAPDGNSVFDALALKAATNRKLDDFGTPDDNTDLDASTTAHGLLLKATAPAAGLRNVVAIDNAETAYTDKALFDATALTAEAFGSTSSVGTAMTAARRDHRHAMAALPAIDATAAATDILTRNASTSAHGLVIKAVAPAAGLTNVLAIENTETIYKMKALFDATNPSTQAFGDAAAVGSAVVSARRDHKHAMMAAPTSLSNTGGSVDAGATAINIDPATDDSGLLNLGTVRKFASMYTKIGSGGYSLNAYNTSDATHPQTFVMSPGGILINYKTALTIADYLGVTRAALNASGDLTLSTGNLIFGTSGKGIDFSATADSAGKTSELFNDYEVGTWTFALTFGAVSTGITYSQNTGLYVKIGGAVFISAYVVLTSKGSATGSAQFRGLPFSVLSDSNAFGSLSFRYASVTCTGYPQGFFYAGWPYINPEAENCSALQDTHFANGSTIMITGWYVPA